MHNKVYDYLMLQHCMWSMLDDFITLEINDEIHIDNNECKIINLHPLVKKNTNIDEMQGE
jgi:hypothetical protein